ncbi:hypothetical protein GCM10008107_07390 [Psychrosphaera saromensis]|uniref:Uncharacterized protein n=1 Tax=Psychrosphaera saromensis TaxID=716813 RepID=A0A2S7UWJ6_9GAMM|nr:alpha/beta hydrolase-fold protein [Psychrosphaera saromensis]PQJ54356.1 hypothetical protein BTO11_12275 [Psychrosphaera saromensis]GHB60667.1 hypothetical protein GCM10008107_07390 [Psychrosphaera saromensis]GLQ14563.1 hypothetical protein GCM10007917_20180 [Psychrosphaera saromensis]
MIKRFMHAVFVFSLLAVNSAIADVRLPIHDKFQSQILSEKRSIVIQLPSSYNKDSKRKYPVMYLLDGPSNLSHTSGTLDFLSLSGEVPELIIVAIANTNRTRDLTPPLKNNKETEGGGANKFLDFLEKELIPYIDGLYRTEDYKIITGHALAGLFAIHSLHTRPHLFQAHFAFSPSLSWDEKSTVTDAINFFAKTPTLKNFLYMNIGDQKGQVRTAFDELSEALYNKKPNEFIFKREYFEKETHMTTPVIGQFYAYRELFANWAFPTANMGLGIKAAEEHYIKLSEYFGFHIPMSENTLNAMGYYHLVQKKDPKAAIKIFARNVMEFPKSANTYDSLAEAYEADGQIEEAIKQMDLAVGIVKKDISLFRVISEHRERLLRKQKSSVENNIEDKVIPTEQ